MSKLVYKHAEKRQEIANRRGWSCFYCGTRLVPMILNPEPEPFNCDLDYHVYIPDPQYAGLAGYSEATIDHMVPRSRGGSGKIDNLTLSCRSCNSKKGRRTATEFIDLMHGGVTS
jgi:hypothetical protein